MARTAVTEACCLTIDGRDARRFAQAQLSADVRVLSRGHWQWNAWLDAQGRVAALMHLANLDDERLLAVLRGGDAERVCSALARYLLRSQAHLAVERFTGYADAAMESGRVEQSGQDFLIGYGGRSLRLVQGWSDPDPAAANAWRLADIRAGWPTLPPDGARFLPPALGLERLGAVSFDKGCYPGQEIAARLHYRGGHKLRLHHLRGMVPLSPGTIRNPRNGQTIYVLDSAFTEDAVEALIVASKTSALQINVLNNIYHVVSTFDA